MCHFARSRQQWLNTCLYNLLFDRRSWKWIIDYSWGETFVCLFVSYLITLWKFWRDIMNYMYVGIQQNINGIKFIIINLKINKPLFLISQDLFLTSLSHTGLAVLSTEQTCFYLEFLYSLSWCILSHLPLWLVLYFPEILAKISPH